MDNKQILSNISTRLGIEALNPMQQAIATSDRRRIILLSPTGSGKTLAFSITVLRHIAPPCGHIQAVIMAPSRELVIQIAGVIRQIATGYKVTALYGGHSMSDEVSSLSVCPDIVVATPGRLLDHLRRGQVDLRRVAILVLDEYDKSLELGFIDEMRRIIKRITGPSTVVLTSATPIDTMPDFIPLKGAKVYDYSGSASSPRSRLDIIAVNSPERDKLDTLVKLLRTIPDGKVIVFANHRESAERIHARLVDAGLPAGLYHGGLDQQRREIAVDMLNNGSTPILVSTDLGSRGLDVDSVSAVVHYHLPPSPESWTHRNGRTARVDATGTVYVILSGGEQCPPYITFDSEMTPAGHSASPIHTNVGTLYINAGKKEKISRGDVAGYATRALGIEAPEVGRIVVRDHYSLVALPLDSFTAIQAMHPAPKIKGVRVKISRIF